MSDPYITAILSAIGAFLAWLGIQAFIQNRRGAKLEGKLDTVIATNEIRVTSLEKDNEVSQTLHKEHTDKIHHLDKRVLRIEVSKGLDDGN